MNNDQENLDPEPQESFRDASFENIEDSQEDYDSPKPDQPIDENIEDSQEDYNSTKPDQPIEFGKDDSIDETTATKKKYPKKKGSLLFLCFMIALSAGGYFYMQKKGIAPPISWSFDKFSPTATNKPEPHAVQSELVPIEPPKEIINQAKDLTSSETIISENEKTINLLRDKIRSLEFELARKNRTLPEKEFQQLIPHISGGTTTEKIKGSPEEKVKEPESEMQTPLSSSMPIKTALNTSAGEFEKELNEFIENQKEESKSDTQANLTPTRPVEAETTFKKNKNQNTSPKRSQEVQAYLDFIEDTGNKIIHLVAKWLNRLISLTH